MIKRWFESEIGGDAKMYRAADTPRPMRLRAVRNGALAEEVEVFRRQQDEYCEWFVERRDGEITGIQFTSEGPEYWRFLMSGTTSFFAGSDPRRDITHGDPDLVLALYREHISPDVAARRFALDPRRRPADRCGMASLRGRGRLQRAQPLDDHRRRHAPDPPVEHAAGRGTARGRGHRAAQRGGRRCAITDLLRWLRDVNRSSDPLIGATVNRAVAAGKFVTLADPIGLYMSEINQAALSDPTAWTPIRRSAADSRILRARIDVPAGGLQVGGVPLEHGGQVAEHIQMILIGLVTDARTVHHPCGTAPRRAVRTRTGRTSGSWSTCRRRLRHDRLVQPGPVPAARPGRPGLAADAPAPRPPRTGRTCEIAAAARPPPARR